MACGLPIAPLHRFEGRYTRRVTPMAQEWPETGKGFHARRPAPSRSRSPSESFQKQLQVVTLAQGGTIKGSINLPAQSLHPSIPTLYTLFTGAGVKKVIFYCGTCFDCWRYHCGLGARLSQLRLLARSRHTCCRLVRRLYSASGRGPRKCVHWKLYTCGRHRRLGFGWGRIYCSHG